MNLKDYDSVKAAIDTITIVNLVAKSVLITPKVGSAVQQIDMATVDTFLADADARKIALLNLKQDIQAVLDAG